MNRPANVKSIDAIRLFRQQLKRYMEKLRLSLETLKVESNRAKDWIEHDRPRYWPRARKQADDRLVEAKNALLRCKMAAMEGQRKSCQDEKNLVAEATRRLRYCEQQVRNTKQWRHQIRHHGDEFEGRMSRLAHYVDDDLPKAIAALDRMIRSLEKYAEGTSRAASSGSSPSTAADTESSEETS